jgi:hypothetical protein
MNIFSSSVVDYEQEFWSDEFPIWSETFSNGQVQDFITIPSGTPLGLVIEGNNLYISDSNNQKVHRIDISESSPQLTDLITGISFGGFIEIVNDKMYIPSFGLSSVNLGSSTPVLTPIFNSNPGILTLGVAISGNDAYIAYRNQGTIIKIDLTETNPIPQEIISGLGTFLNDISIINNDLYIARSGDERISKIDITQSNPMVIDVVTGVNPIDLLLFGNDMYFSGNNSVKKISITETNPTPSVIVDGLSSPVWGIEISNNILYMAQQSDNKILSFGL